MTSRAEQRHLRAIKLLQRRSRRIKETQNEVTEEISDIKARLQVLGPGDNDTSNDSPARGNVQLHAMGEGPELTDIPLDTIISKAYRQLPADADLADILTAEDWLLTNERITASIQDFNNRHGLDRWDYAIAGSCGLFAAMVDLLFVRAPPNPTTAWTNKVDGVVNENVRRAFNGLIPPELSDRLGHKSKIGGADASTGAHLLGALPRTLNPWNHRLRSLSHDPILGLLFGILDARRGTCTVVGRRGLKIYPTVQEPIEEGWFKLLGRMFGHLLSDVNAPSEGGNRGMGLPAPFMGLLRMCDGLPGGERELGAQIDIMYAKGYDFRQFVVTSVPALIMEVMMRALYAVKQNGEHGSTLADGLIDTMPGRMNPRFRTMLLMGYGTMAAVNGGKVYVSRDVLNLNYAAWMGFMWNGLHAMKWAMLDRSLKLWGEIETKEIEGLERCVGQIQALGDRAGRLSGAD